MTAPPKSPTAGSRWLIEGKECTVTMAFSGEPHEEAIIRGGVVIVKLPDGTSRKCSVAWFRENAKRVPRKSA